MRLGSPSISKHMVNGTYGEAQWNMLQKFLHQVLENMWLATWMEVSHLRRVVHDKKSKTITNNLNLCLKNISQL